MKVRIRVSTPKGQAQGTLKLMGAYFKFNLKDVNTYVNKEDSEIYMEYEGDVRRCIGLMKRANMYHTIVQKTLGYKSVQAAIKKLADRPQDVELLNQMLKKDTKIEIIKEATASEIVEANKTYWQRIKETFIHQKS